jgi:hypothetical protein
MFTPLRVDFKLSRERFSRGRRRLTVGSDLRANFNPRRSERERCSSLSRNDQALLSYLSTGWD